MNRVMLEALNRILENQVTIKEHFGIIKKLNRWDDNEYYRDSLILEELEEVLADVRASEIEDEED